MGILPQREKIRQESGFISVALLFNTLYHKKAGFASGPSTVTK